MKPVTEPILCAAASAFDFGGPTVCDPHHYGEGHINDTFVVWRADHTKRFILQRINTDTFTDPAGLMENICGVTRHLRTKIQAEGGDPSRECLNVIPTLSGAAYYIDSEGNAWRAYDFVENTGSSLSSYQSGTLLQPMHCVESKPLRRRLLLSMHGKRTATFCWINWPLVRSRCVSPIMIPKSIMFCSMKPLAKASVSLTLTP